MEDRIIQIEQGLEDRFLYENDADSMHILLSMIDHQHKRSNIQPRYTLMRNIAISLKKVLSFRKDREYIVQAVRKLISDDVNRFEMAIFLKGYANGWHASGQVDRLERLALEEYSPEQLSHRTLLYHNAKDGKVMGLQSHTFHFLRTETDGFATAKRLSNLYCRKVLKRKIYQLNGSLNSQIVLDFEHLSHLKMEEGRVNVQEMNFIYSKINRYLYNNISKVYKFAYWSGMNDAVLERYVR